MIVLVIIALPVTIKHLFFKDPPQPESSFDISVTPSPETPSYSGQSPVIEETPAQSGAAAKRRASAEPTKDADGFITVDKDYFKDVSIYRRFTHGRTLSVFNYKRGDLFCGYRHADLQRIK